MTILKKHVKILRYVRLHRIVTISVLDRRYSYDVIRDLLWCKYLTCDNDTRQEDDFCQKTGEYPPASQIRLTDSGLAEVEARDWFNMEYFVTRIVVPIVIGVVSSTITNLLWP